MPLHASRDPEGRLRRLARRRLAAAADRDPTPSSSATTPPPARPPSPAAAAWPPSSPAGSPAPPAPAATASDGGDGGAPPRAAAPGALQRAGARRPPCRVELPLRRVRRTDEVRVVGIREPVRLGAHLCDHAPLLEREDGVDDSGGEEVPLDLLPPLCVGARVRSPARSPSAAPPPTEPTLRRNDAPAGVGVRTSRCGDRGPVSEPPPRNAPRRYAPRQQARATTRPGGRSSGRWSRPGRPPRRA